MLAACGGQQPGEEPLPPPPSRPPTPPAAANDACSTALGQEADTANRLASLSAPLKLTAASNDDVDVEQVIWNHRSRSSAGMRVGPLVETTATEDIGDIAVIEDDGSIVLPANRFDLQERGLRVAATAGTLQVSAADPAFRVPLGTPLTLSDDDTVEVPLPAPLPFAGQRRSAVFVNSDGNVTFEESDVATSERSVARIVNGPPRIAPFFGDLDPSAGGRVFVNARPDVLTVTWCRVPGFSRTEVATTQLALLPDGAIELRFGPGHALLDGIVAVAPGRGVPFTPVDLSSGAGAGSALGERFSVETDLDLVVLASRFYRTHADTFDQLVVFADQRIIPLSGAVAFETTVKSSVTGIGLDPIDRSAEFGSGGRLQSMVVMDRLSKYPENFADRAFGDGSTLAVLAHEVGHRWLAFLPFRGLDGSASRALLGRANSHWSFFFDSDASVMEGNDIEDQGGGSFRTVDAMNRYSLLDQYAMGLVSAAQVPAFYYVEAPLNVVPDRVNASSPSIGVTFNGTRREVRIEDVIAVVGDRRPSVAESPKVFTQAFVYLIGRGRTVGAADVAKLDRLRREFEAYFSRATDNRMRVTTALRPT